MVSVLFEIGSQVHLVFREGECNMCDTDVDTSQMSDMGELFDESLLKYTMLCDCTTLFSSVTEHVVDVEDFISHPLLCKTCDSLFWEHF